MIRCHAGKLLCTRTCVVSGCHCHSAVYVQSVPAAADGAGSRHVDRDTANRQVPAVHVYPRLHFGDRFRVRAQPDAAILLDAHDAGLRALRVHQHSAAPALHAAPGRSPARRRRLLPGSQRTASVRQSIQEGDTTTYGP